MILFRVGRVRYRVVVDGVGGGGEVGKNEKISPPPPLSFFTTPDHFTTLVQISFSHQYFTKKLKAIFWHGDFVNALVYNWLWIKAIYTGQEVIYFTFWLCLIKESMQWE